MYATVREGEVRAAAMRAPEVVHVAFVVEPAWLVHVRTGRTRDGRIRIPEFRYSEQKFAGSRIALARGRIPPTMQETRRRRTLTGEQRLAAAIRDVGNPHPRIAKQHAVL